MEEGSHHHHHKAPPPPPPPSRLGMRSPASFAGGEIVEVQGGHIVRSTGRKDRHSKVCTAKGPRDRRVRLSAHTAIQFYDVQDRLGYDRPSKAVDWLIKKAKTAIDELAELPPWNPVETLAATPKSRVSKTKTPLSNNNKINKSNIVENRSQLQNPQVENASGSLGRSGGVIVDFDPRRIGDPNPAQGNGSGFIPPSLDSDSIADTIKSFFPVGVPSETTPLYHQPHTAPDLLSRTSSHQSQDLRLSLQSFNESQPLILHHHHGEPVLFSSHNSSLGFDSPAVWENHPHQHHHNHQHAAAAHDIGGFVFANTMPFQPVMGGHCGQSQFFTQRGPLQSSNTPMIRAWVDHYHHHQQINTDDLNPSQNQNHHGQTYQTLHQSAIPGLGLAAPSGEFAGFFTPARIHGEDEEHDGGISNKPSSVSSVSRH